MVFLYFDSSFSFNINIFLIFSFSDSRFFLFINSSSKLFRVIFNKISANFSPYFFILIISFSYIDFIKFLGSVTFNFVINLDKMPGTEKLIILSSMPNLFRIFNIKSIM